VVSRNPGELPNGRGSYFYDERAISVTYLFFLGYLINIVW